MEIFSLDTNVVIRFLTNDDPDQSPLAYRLFEGAANGDFKLHLSPVIVAECCWVLESNRYGYDKRKISEQLTVMISSQGTRTEEKNSVLMALRNYSEQDVDFIDAWLAAHADITPAKNIITWNKKHFKRLNVEFFLPGEILQ